MHADKIHQIPTGSPFDGAGLNDVSCRRLTSTTKSAVVQSIAGIQRRIYDDRGRAGIRIGELDLEPINIAQNVDVLKRRQKNLWGGVNRQDCPSVERLRQADSGPAVCEFVTSTLQNGHIYRNERKYRLFQECCGNPLAVRARGPFGGRNQFGGRSPPVVHPDCRFKRRRGDAHGLWRPSRSRA